VCSAFWQLEIKIASASGRAGGVSSCLGCSPAWNVNFIPDIALSQLRYARNVPWFAATQHCRLKATWAQSSPSQHTYWCRTVFGVLYQLFQLPQKRKLLGVKPCGLLKVNQQFARIFRLHIQGRRISQTSRFILRPWRYRRHVPLKRPLSFNGLHGVVPQKIELFCVSFKLDGDASWEKNSHPEDIGIRFLRNIGNEGESVNRSQMEVQQL
jgi:hypothetical protein